MWFLHFFLIIGLYHKNMKNTKLYIIVSLYVFQSLAFSDQNDFLLSAALQIVLKRWSAVAFGFSLSSN